MLFATGVTNPNQSNRRRRCCDAAAFVLKSINSSIVFFLLHPGPLLTGPLVALCGRPSIDHIISERSGYSTAAMGRVRKYKKIKAIDPFSKRKVLRDESKYDLPPDASMSKLDQYLHP